MQGKRPKVLIGYTTSRQQQARSTHASGKQPALTMPCYFLTGKLVIRVLATKEEKILVNLDSHPASMTTFIAPVSPERINTSYACSASASLKWCVISSAGRSRPRVACWPGTSPLLSIPRHVDEGGHGTVDACDACRWTCGACLLFSTFVSLSIATIWPSCRSMCAVQHAAWDVVCSP